MDVNPVVYTRRTPKRQKYDAAMDILSSDQEKQVKKVKRKLESWREAILPLYFVLTWDKKWYPLATAGVVSVFYLILWCIDPTVITMISGIGIALSVLDFLVPAVIANFYPKNSWTKNEEKLFEEICKSIVIHYNYINITCVSFYKMRESSPKLYYALLIVLLIITAWIGATIDNMFLAYLTTLTVSLSPGLLSNEKFSTHIGQFVHFVNSLLNSKKKD